MGPEDRSTRLGLVLAVVLPLLFAFATAVVVRDPSGPGIRGGGRSPTVLARLAERPLTPLEARPGAAAPRLGRREPVADGIRPAPPARISIPAAGVNASVQAVGERGGAIEVPPIGRAGWFDAGPRPGEPGRAIVIGHLDSRDGPGLFARLPSLPAGTDISVSDRRGEVHRYALVGGAEVAKDRFPASEVYGAASAPVLVLITCGGRFENGHYRDNLLLYARAA